MTEAQAAQDATPSAAESSSLLNDPHTMAQIYDMAEVDPQPVASKNTTSRDLTSKKGGGMSMPKFGRRQTVSLDQARVSPSKK